MTGFGPLTCGVHGPIGDPANNCDLFDTGQTGTALRNADVTVASSIAGPGGTAWHFLIIWYDVADTPLRLDDTGTLGFASNPSANLTVAAPAGATRMLVRFGSAINAPNTATGTVNGTYTSDAYCQYGTEVKPGTPDVVYLLPTLITAIVGAISDGWAWPLASVFGGHALDIGALCAYPQPTAVPLTVSDLIKLVDLGDPLASLAVYNKAWQWLRAAAWQYFCQCTPGGGLTPVKPPPPGPTSLTGSQPAPVVLCDGGDPCAALASLQATVNAIFQQLNNTSQLLTLVQRQHVPFAYVPGTLHSGLTGAGDFPVSGILGLAVQVTTVPGASGESAGDPIGRFGLGWVTTGTADGWRQSIPIRHNPQWVDVAPDDTIVGYSLEVLVEANIQEFTREP